MESLDDHAALRDELLRLELALAERREGDLPPGGYEDVLDEAFSEVGASGRLWTRDATLEALAGTARTTVEIDDFAIDILGPDAVLATYRTVGSRPAHRASVWVRDAGRWRMRYHQATLL